MTDRQARWAQLALAAVAVASGAFILVSCLTGCGESRTVEQDITICRGICGARPIDDFSSGSDWRNLSCRCGKLDPSPNPCPDAGITRPRIDPW